jgi:hypothetical protein
MSLRTRSLPDLPADNQKADRSPRPEYLELPRPWRLMVTAGWNLAESLGLPVAGYLVGAKLGGEGAFLSSVWFIQTLRRSGLHVRFTQA